MDYKKVLENQIKQLEALQGRLVDLVVDKKADFTSRVITSVVETSSRIESLTSLLIEIEKETATNKHSSGQDILK